MIWAVILISIKPSGQDQRATAPSTLCKPEDPLDKLTKFQVIRNGSLRYLLHSAPWLILSSIIIFLELYALITNYLFELGIAYIHSPKIDVLFISRLLAASMILLAFKYLEQQIPKTLFLIWNRRIICRNMEGGDSNSIASCENSKKYADFIVEFEELLNHPLQWLSSIIVFLVWFIIPMILYELSRLIINYFGPWEIFYGISFINNLSQFIEISLRGYIAANWHSLWLTLPIDFFVASLIGLAAWRMFVVSFYIAKLGRDFNLHPLIGHPDKCGGLEPLGKLCLYNALIISIWGIYLGLWIIFGTTFSEGQFYRPLHILELTVPISLRIIIFFLPLWKVHNMMSQKRYEVHSRLDPVGSKIDQISQNLMEIGENLDSAQGKAFLEEAEALHKISPDRRLPTWPVNKDLLIKLTIISGGSPPCLERHW